MYECKIAEKLVELRTIKGATQEDVAQSLSVSNKTISKWENGASMPDLPMLVELSKYYGVTTDALLGLSEDKKQSTTEEVRAILEDLGRKESLLKAFEMVKSIIPAVYESGKLTEQENSAHDHEDIFPSEIPCCYRSQIRVRNFFEFVASSENVNVAVMMLQNKAKFAWLKDPSNQKEIVKLFKFLSCEDVLSVLYFIHSTACSESFTADYITRNTGVSEERVFEILDEFCSVGACHWVTAQLAEGEVKVYECRGDGIILSLLSLAFERMCGKPSYEYNFNGNSKMIGGN